MTCRDAAGFLSDYIGGDLAPAVAADFEGHIANCTNCHQYLTQFRHTILASQAACHDSDAGLPAEMPEELVKAILESVAKA